MTDLPDHPQTAEIQRAINSIVKGMLGKGLREPDCRFILRANGAPQVYLTWKVATRDRFGSDQKYEFFDGAGDIRMALAEASGFIAGMPEKDEARKKEFLTALGSVIELGRENDIDVEVINPLVATMKRLSENALTHHGRA